MADDLRTTELRELLVRVADDDSVARNELLQRVTGNLERLTRKMLSAYPSVRRWEQTDDVLVQASMRLMQALKDVSPADTKRFFGLAALKIRQELLDMARRYKGRFGLGANHVSRGGADPEPAAPGPEADGLADWEAFHHGVAALSEPDREIFGLLHYQGLSQAEAAEILGLSVAAVQQRWQRARLRLHDELKRKA